MLSRLLSRYWLLIPILIIVVIAVDQVEEPAIFELEETINMRDTRSDYYMADFRSRKYDTEGKIEYTIQGEKLAHFPDTDHSEIVAPRIELHRQDALWDISSSSGRFNPNPDLFILQGNVRIKRQQEGADAVTIETSTLRIATESNEVSTDKPIRIISPNWVLEAVGMASAIDDGKLTLLSGVTGRFEVQNAP